jgi:hypothetical protein
MVQSGPDVIEAVPHENAETVRNGGDIRQSEPPSILQDSPCSEIFLNDLRKWMRVGFVNESVWVAFNPCVGFSLERVQVFLSAVEFE